MRSRVCGTVLWHEVLYYVPDHRGTILVVVFTGRGCLLAARTEAAGASVPRAELSDGPRLMLVNVRSAVV